MISRCRWSGDPDTSVSKYYISRKHTKNCHSWQSLKIKQLLLLVCFFASFLCHFLKCFGWHIWTYFLLKWDAGVGNQTVEAKVVKWEAVQFDRKGRKNWPVVKIDLWHVQHEVTTADAAFFFFFQKAALFQENQETISLALKWSICEIIYCDSPENILSIRCKCITTFNAFNAILCFTKDFKSG